MNYIKLILLCSTVLLVSVISGQYPLELNIVPPQKTIKNIQWSADGLYLAVRYGDSNQLDIFDTVSGKLAKTLEMADNITSFAWSPDNKHIALASETGTIALFNYKEFKLLGQKVNVNRNPIEAVAWSADSRFLAVASSPLSFVNGTLVYGDTTVVLWNANTIEIAKIYKFKGYATDVKWSKEGNLAVVTTHDQASATKAASIFIGNPTNTEDTIKEISEDKKIKSFLWSHKRNYYMAHFEDGTCKIATPEGDTLNTHELESCFSDEIGWSPDDKYIAGTDSNTLTILHALLSDKTKKLALQKQLDSEKEDKDIVASHTVWAPHGPLIAAAIRGKFDFPAYHKLFIFEVHTLDHGFKKIMARQTNQPINKYPNARTESSARSNISSVIAHLLERGDKKEQAEENSKKRKSQEISQEDSATMPGPKKQKLDKKNITP